MVKYYLDFEKPVQELDNRLAELETLPDIGEETAREIERLKEKRNQVLKKIYSGLSRWQRVQLARHPQRPYSLDYIRYMAPDFIELHGDRHFANDTVVVCGLGTVDNEKIAFIGQQKGRNTKENLHRNFGMMRPEGYRKALRIMKLAEKFRLPVVSLLDTQGAYPGIGAEERGQGEAIARNLLEMSKLSVPIIAIVIGEGASGGALGIGVCDRMIMLENTWYSVISPEGCASILWRDAAKAKDAADAMQVIPADLMKMGICDRIVKEPLGGAHRKPDEMLKILKGVVLEEITALKDKAIESFLDHRILRYEKMGVFLEA
ncbi:MAG: acetyl-CoA carboxylase carboxyltransferase subunit alpha [Fidelibacterota bacterium]